MSSDDRGGFTLADIRALRWLAFALAAVALGMWLITDRDTPLLVLGFIVVLAVVPIAAIYVLRRARKTKTPELPSEPRSAR